MLTKLYPMVQFKKDTWEIDEFDNASIFLLIGEEKAMVIDTGMGIGDLRGAIEMITDKPLICVISHNHIDHTGNARQFGEIWMSPKEPERPIPQSKERRRFDIERVAARQKGSITAPYNMFHLYPYDIETDLRDGDDEPEVVVHDLLDGMQFDLGGGRIVTAYECPGHAPGEMVFLDEQTRTLFSGDALNFNLGCTSVPLETAYKALKRIQAMGDKYDGIWNGHHDFRALGMPLDDDCLPNVLAMMEDALAGHIVECECPSFWGQSIPLTRSKEANAFNPPPAYKGEVRPNVKRVIMRRGRNWLGIDPDNIKE